MPCANSYGDCHQKRKLCGGRCWLAIYGEEDLGGWKVGSRAAREGSLVVKALVRLGDKGKDR